MIHRLALGYATSMLLLGACLGKGPAGSGEDAHTLASALDAPIPAGDYVLHTDINGHCLDVSGASTADGAKVQEWTCNGTVAQVFHITPHADGYYEIRNVNSDKSLDVTGISSDPNVFIEQWTYWGGPNQLFAIVDRGGGQFSIHPQNSGLTLDVYWGNEADGTPICQYYYSGRPNQLWSFEQVGGGSAQSGGNQGGGNQGGGTQGAGPLPTRLRVTSNCADPIWIAHSDNLTDAQNVRLGQGQSYDYAIPGSGLQAMRVWPKSGCDGNGVNCAIGESVAPCPAGGCQPPVESKFEASFTATGSADPTWYNLSQVDGYTLPFKVVPHGNGAESGSCVTSDCSGLSLGGCPSGEDMSGGGEFGAYAHEDLRIFGANGQVIGCMSPCKKWNYPSPWGLGQPEAADPGLHMCCPTPIDPNSGQCTAANACMTSQSCSDASDPVSVVHTQYVAAIRSMCPSAYSYAYDDKAGLHNCPSETSFEVVFCP